jgi:hypothetical protein
MTILALLSTQADIPRGNHLWRRAEQQIDAALTWFKASLVAMGMDRASENKSVSGSGPCSMFVMHPSEEDCLAQITELFTEIHARIGERSDRERGRVIHIIRPVLKGPCGIDWLGRPISFVEKREVAKWMKLHAVATRDLVFGTREE